MKKIEKGDLIKITRKIDCPYCGVGIVYFQMELNGFYTQEKVLTYDIDMGGCDRAFVIKLRPSLDIEIGRIEYDNKKIT